MENRTFQFGKYKGKFIPEVIQNDPSYVKWAYLNLDNFQLSEPEKYLLYTRLTKEGIIDEQLLADIKTIPQATPDVSFDVDSFMKLLEPLKDCPLYSQREALKEDYDELMSCFQKGIPIAFNHGEVSTFYFYSDKAEKVLKSLRNRFNYIVKRPQFSESMKTTATKMVVIVDKIISSFQPLVDPYRRKMEEISGKQRERDKLIRLQAEAKKQEEQKAERNAAVDKHPYKDIDESFIVKLDDVLGSNKYKINQCVYRIDYDSSCISAYQVRELKSIFGESKIEVTEREDKISVYITQNIESVTSDMTANKYILLLQNFILDLKPDERTYLFSLGKEESKQIFEKALKHFEDTGNFPTFGMVVADDAHEKELTVEDIKNWLNKASEKDLSEIRSTLTQEKEDTHIGSENKENKESQEINEAVDSSDDLPF